MDASYYQLDDIVYMTNKDGSYRVTLGFYPGRTQADNKSNIENYRWREGDFLLNTFLKCGTNLAWEIMMMLVNGDANYIGHSMVYSLLDLTSAEVLDERCPSPRVVTTHYRQDVLPDDFRNKKTVYVIRNPKDAAVSLFNFVKHIMHSMHGLDPNLFTFNELLNEFLDTSNDTVMRNPKDAAVSLFNFVKHEMHPMHGLDSELFTFDELLDEFLDINNDTVLWGNYFKHVEHTWELSKTRSDMCVMFYEDIVLNPVENVRKLNEFMGTGRDDDLIQKIAEAIEFNKMKAGKRHTELETIPNYTCKDSAVGIASSKDEVGDEITVYRKGKVGEWKNWFTVAMNEKFDKHLQAWKPAQEIPFIYE